MYIRVAKTFLLNQPCIPAKNIVFGEKNCCEISEKTTEKMTSQRTQRLAYSYILKTCQLHVFNSKHIHLLSYERLG